MTRFGWLMFLVLVLAIGLLSAGAWYLHTINSAPIEEVHTSTQNIVDPSALSIYTNGEHGFSFFYPAGATVSDSYSTSTSATVLWKIGAMQKGTAIVRVEGVRDELRLGMSTTSKAIFQCVKSAPSEKGLGDIKMASTTWSVFSFDQLGTDDQTHVTSYRTLHNEACFALETIEPVDTIASSTAPNSSPVGAIVQSFSFSRP